MQGRMLERSALLYSPIPRPYMRLEFKGSSVAPVMSGGAGTSLGPGLPVSQLRLRHLTYGRAGQTARTRMPRA